MKRSLGLLLGILFVISGCTYHGNMKTDIYKSNLSQGQLPIKAYMLWDQGLDNGKYISNGIYRNHGVEISTAPGLKSAFINAMNEVFTDIKVVDSINNNMSKEYRVVLYPKFEVRSQAVYIQVTAKDYETDELIDKYEASGNVMIDNPTSATVLSVLNVIPCAMLCTPFIEPIINNIVGEQHQKDFEARVVESLKSIVTDMQRDRKYKNKYSKLN